MDALTPITDYPIFAALSAEEKHRLLAATEQLSFSRQEFIFQEGDRAGHVFFVASGEVKLGSQVDGRREIIRNVLRPNAMFGQLAITGTNQRDGFAQSLVDDTVVYRLPIAGLQELMAQNFDFCQLILHNIGQQLQLAQRRLANVVSLNARTRIIEFLRESVRAHGRKVGLEYLVSHSLTHQDIANITCTSRQTVTLVLNELRNANLIYFNRGRILVRDLNALG